MNVHPAKLEVKFANEKEVFEAVFYAVRGALEKRIPRPTMGTSPDKVDERKAEKLLNSFVPLKDGARTPNHDPLREP